MRRSILSLILVATAFAASPATAAGMRPQQAVQRQIRSDITQLQDRIDRDAQRRIIGRAEAVSLRQQAMSVERLYDRYRIGGLNGREAAALVSRISVVDQQLRQDRRN